MPPPEDYRRHATACLRIAEGVTDSEDRTWLIDMAQAWLKLAYQAEKNLTSYIVRETPPLPSEAVSPPVMQQQQIQPNREEIRAVSGFRIVPHDRLRRNTEHDTPDETGVAAEPQRREETDPPSWRSEEPAPVDVVRFGQNLAEIIARAMKASSRWGRRHR
jgi:hypothetical protein